MSTQIELLKKYGLPVRGFSGQHLLVEPALQQKIVHALGLRPRECVIEIGPGLGALTAPLLESGARVWAIEKDPRFAEILQGELGDDYKKQLTVICADALQVRLDKWRKQSGEWKLISNLPYYITAPVLFHILEYRDLFSKAVLMMQREVAKRLVATPGTKDYGRLSLAVRYHADVDHLFDVAPTCFTPRPEVHSSVVELTMHPRSKMPKDIDETLLFGLIKTAFGQRRKTLRHNLVSDPALNLSREKADRLFKDLGWSSRVRGEELLLKDYLDLTARVEALRAAKGKKP